VTPEAKQHIDKARECLTHAKTILAAGIGEDAGRNAYLAGLHAAKAVIFERTRKVAKTHRGVRTLFSELAKDDAILSQFTAFLAEAYVLKSIADYEVGPDAIVSLDEASSAIEQAVKFVECIAESLG